MWGRAGIVDVVEGVLEVLEVTGVVEVLLATRCCYACSGGGNTGLFIHDCVLLLFLLSALLCLYLQRVAAAVRVTRSELVENTGAWIVRPAVKRNCLVLEIINPR